MAGIGAPPRPQARSSVARVPDNSLLLRIITGCVISHYMNPRPASNLVQIALRLPLPWLDKADDLAGSLATPGRTPSRTDVLREAIAVGLEELRKGGGTRIGREPAFQERAWKHLLDEVLLLVQASNIKALEMDALPRSRVIVLSDGSRTRNVTSIEAAWEAIHDWPGTQFPEYLFEQALNEKLTLEAYVSKRNKRAKKK